MKKIIIFFMCVVCFVFFISSLNKSSSFKKDISFDDEVRGVFVSYIDYGILFNKSKLEQENIIDEMINNIDMFGLNSIILQVRPFSDAIYFSDIYLSSSVVVNNEGDELPLDILDYFIKEGKKKGISIYAWINPYRIRSNNDLSSINKDSYYYDWIDTDNIEVSEKGIYLNPASKEVLDYNLKGLKELCLNYDIDGIIYDDYYYPSDTIDLNNYDSSDKKLSLEEYRINNINNLIKESYNAIKDVNKNIRFGISPGGNISNNLKKEYLDVNYLIENKYLDFIIPQLYYGFDNDSKPFIKTLNDWILLNKNNIDFYVALSLYKSGKVDQYAGSGENEWLNDTDIIKKQIVISRNKVNYNGFYIFRYEYLFNMYKNENLNYEINNLRNLINKK